MQTTNLHLKKQHGMWETLPSRWFLASKGWFIRKYHLTNITRLKLSKLENKDKFQLWICLKFSDIIKLKIKQLQKLLMC